jgi:DUF971 family protein
MLPLAYEQRMPDVIAPSLEKRAIDIKWLDGHQSSFDFEFLRWSCPCAICRGEGASPGVLATTERLTPEQTALTDVGPVGNYAMSIAWQDGHTTGIYSWDYLRRICPCPECASRRTKVTPPGNRP